VAEVELSAGPIEYEDTGGAGPLVVLLHGLAMTGSVCGTSSPTCVQTIAASSRHCRWAVTGVPCTRTPTSR
jgi:hypothetical protein